MSVLSMLTLPNDHRDKIVCQSCGEVLRRRPMQTAGEAVLVWTVVLGASVPLVMFGGNAGIAITLSLLLVLGWIAPWQGLTYELSTGKDEIRGPLPAAKLLSLPPPESPDPGGEPPNSGDPQP